jgi:hypothetical protein
MERRALASAAWSESSMPVPATLTRTVTGAPVRSIVDRQPAARRSAMRSAPASEVSGSRSWKRLLATLATRSVARESWRRLREIGPARLASHASTDCPARSCLSSTIATAAGRLYRAARTLSRSSAAFHSRRPGSVRSSVDGRVGAGARCAVGGGRFAVGAPGPSDARRSPSVLEEAAVVPRGAGRPRRTPGPSRKASMDSPVRSSARSGSANRRGRVDSDVASGLRVEGLGVAPQRYRRRPRSSVDRRSQGEFRRRWLSESVALRTIVEVDHIRTRTARPRRSLNR